MSAAPAYRETLRRLLEAMRAEVAALDAGDLTALEAGTAAKLAAVSALQLSPLSARDPEVDAMIQEGAELNAKAATRVNLLLAQTERRIEALAAAKGHAAPQRYGRNGRMAAPLRRVELDRA
jgi:hypothetical protein